MLSSMLVFDDTIIENNTWMKMNSYVGIWITIKAVI